MKEMYIIKHYYPFHGHTEGDDFLESYVFETFEQAYRYVMYVLSPTKVEHIDINGGCFDIFHLGDYERVEIESLIVWGSER